MFGSLITFIIVLSVLVFVHEFCHFYAAKKLGATVEEFGFGFPPRAIGIKRRGTIYSINWLPIGGFVRIKGENGDDDSQGSFTSLAVWKRAIILSAGVIMNLLLAWFILTIGLIIGMPQIVDNIPSNASVRDEKIQVVSVLEKSPAAEAGISAGDIIVNVNGQDITSVELFRDFTSVNQDKPLTVEYTHQGENKTTTITPRILTETGRPGAGVGLAETATVSYPFYIAPLVAAKGVAQTVIDTFRAFGGMIRDLLVTQRVSVDVSGPVGIAFLTADVAKMGGLYLLQFMAVLSINLAVINVLPIPALDGGRLLFLIIEKIRGRSVNQKIEGVVHAIGFFLLISLIVVVTYRDLIKFGDRITGAFIGG